MDEDGPLTRRRLFAGALSTGAALWAGRAYADLLPTPRLTEGPYYPDHVPLDQDNDLVTVGNSGKLADGEITHLTGRVLDVNGNPVRSVVVEIWQCDAHQVYLHSSDSGPKATQRDRNFQGFGKFETSSKGEYYFRTIKPVPYPGRPGPHIHVKVKKGDRELLTTQMLIRGHAGNARDNIFNGTRDPIDRELILVDFNTAPNKPGELQARFDIILGRTPDDGQMNGGRPRR